MSATDKHEKLRTPKECAAFLRISTRTLLAQARAGTIPDVRLNERHPVPPPYHPEKTIMNTTILICTIFCVTLAFCSVVMCVALCKAAKRAENAFKAMRRDSMCN